MLTGDEMVSNSTTCSDLNDRFSDSPHGGRDAERPAETSAARVGMAILLVAFAAAGCRDPLNVPDPNSIQSSDLDSPAAVPSLVNGALKNMNQMFGSVAALYGTTSDEVRFIGSQEGWGRLSDGFLGNPANNFPNEFWPDVTRARYMVDRSISQAEEFQAELADRTHLAHAYLQGGVVYATIADVYDDFVIPDDPREPAPPVGPSNMVQLYDQAIAWLDSAESLAKQLGDGELVSRAIGYRARVRHAKAVWGKLNPPGSTPADPLVSNQQMLDDARLALQRIGTSSDWRWTADFSVGTTGLNQLADWLTERGDLQFGATFVDVDENNSRVITGIALDDPVTGEPSPVIQRKVNEFRAGGRFPSLNILTARELHLLVAEHYLAEGDTASSREYVNNVRSIAGLPEFTGQIGDLEMLQNSRKVHLFLMQRRLADLYRFGVRSDTWLPQSDAYRSPGTFFPIPLTEIRNNPQVSGSGG